MNIVGLKQGHDGSICYLSDGSLEFSYENEKGGRPRYSSLQIATWMGAFEEIDSLPDAIAIGGWARRFSPRFVEDDPAYFGVSNDAIGVRQAKVFGKTTELFTSSHERSHVVGSFGMSPFPLGQRCYCLIWEGNIGSFYLIDEKCQISKVGTPLNSPGNKYSFFYALAHRAVPDVLEAFRFEDAGKLMALSAYGTPGRLDQRAERLLDEILGRDQSLFLDKSEFAQHELYNAGVESQVAKDFFRRATDEIFDRFAAFARDNLNEALPLVIGGGCGLNCEWNTRFADSGLFTEVFVPPCTNDTGSAIGSALDAQLYFTGTPKISWSVYSGPRFRNVPVEPPAGFRRDEVDLAMVARLLARGGLVATALGRCEIGPRALGNRSILAAPFNAEMHDRLNRIKGRESFRPIAPICREEDVGKLFSGDATNPYMLFFCKVISDAIPAVTHVDGTARVQCVTPTDNPHIHELLNLFAAESGIGVLCNTSLNEQGAGFINDTKSLLEFVATQGLDCAITDDEMYVREGV